eukprot:gene3395-13435_t
MANRTGPPASPSEILQESASRTSATLQPLASISPSSIRQLTAGLLKGKSGLYLQLVPVPLLKKLLGALYHHISCGYSKKLDEDSHDAGELHLVTNALDAGVAALYILSTPGMPPQVNVLAFLDARFQKLWRPQELEEMEPSAKKSKKSSKARNATKISWVVPPFLRQSLGALDLAIQLLSEVLSLVRVDSQMLLPLVRTALQTLTVHNDTIQVLRVKATGFVASVFRHHESQRQAILDEVMHGLLQHLHPGAGNRPPPRQYLASEDGTTTIQVFVALVLQLFQGVADSPPVNADMADFLTLIPRTSCCPPLTPGMLQVFVALVLQLVQGVADLSPVDADMTGVLISCGLPSSWVDRFLSSIMDRLPSARSSKADMSVDLKALVENFLQDLLSVQHMPEWPGAKLLLRRFLIQLNSPRGLLHPESGVRLLCIDFLGIVATHLVVDCKEAEHDQKLVAALVAWADAHSPESQGALASLSPEEALDLMPPAQAQELLNQILLKPGSSEGGKPQVSKPELTALVVRHRSMLGDSSAGLSNLETCTISAGGASDPAGNGNGCDQEAASTSIELAGGVVDRATAAVISRWLLVNSTVGKGRESILKWLVEAGSNGKQDLATIRAKVIKSLGSIIAADVAVLGYTDVQAAVRMALEDDSSSVRDAAVDLIGRHISKSRELALAYFDVISMASADKVKEGTATADAIVLILSHAADTEGSIQKLSTSICSELWFTPGSTIDDSSEAANRSPQQRARQLAAVCQKVYTGDGSSKQIRLPFLPNNPVVVVISAILGRDRRGTGSGAQQAQLTLAAQGASEVAAALLDRVLQLHDMSSAAEGPREESTLGTETDGSAAPGSPEKGSAEDHGSPASIERELLGCLLALHALCSADPELCIPKKDPARFVRCLAPYLKLVDKGGLIAPKQGGESAEEGSRRMDLNRLAAERLLCVIHIVESLCRRLVNLDRQLAEDIVTDLRLIINSHNIILAVAGACQCLSTLLVLKPELVHWVKTLLMRIHRILDRDLKEGVLPSKAPVNTRLLVIAGQLCRYGATLLDSQNQADLEAASTCPKVTTTDFFNLFLAYYNLPQPNKMAEAALGLLVVSCPELMVDLVPVINSALQPSAPAAIKNRMLTNLVELLRAEEDGMFSRQRVAEEIERQSAGASTLPAAAPKALSRINGEGDGTSISGSILQQVWPLILALAKDVPGPPPKSQAEPPATPLGSGASAGGLGASAGVRRRVLDLIEIVQRGGLTAPWLAIPSLVALVTDPSPDVSMKALDVLTQCSDKYVEFVAGQMSPGLLEAYAFQRRLWEYHNPGEAMREMPLGVMDQISVLWACLLQPHKGLKSKFLSSLLKPFEDSSQLATPAGTEPLDPQQLWFCAKVAAELPYKRMDEPLILMYSINQIISRRGDAAVAALKDALAQEKSKLANPEAATSNGGLAAANSAFMGSPPAPPGGGTPSDRPPQGGIESSTAAATPSGQVMPGRGEATAPASASITTAATPPDWVVHRQGVGGATSTMCEDTPQGAPSTFITTALTGQDQQPTRSFQAATPSVGQGNCIASAYTAATPSAGGTSAMTPLARAGSQPPRAPWSTARAGISHAAGKAANGETRAGRTPAAGITGNGEITRTPAAVRPLCRLGISLSLAIKASLSVSSLLFLKQFLKTAYRLPDERVAAFLPGSVSKKTEEKHAAVKLDTKIRFDVSMLDFKAHKRSSLKSATELLKTIKYLLKNDSFSYRVAQPTEGAAPDAAVDHRGAAIATTPSSAHPRSSIKRKASRELDDDGGDADWGVSKKGQGAKARRRLEPDLDNRGG